MIVLLTTKNCSACDLTEVVLRREGIDYQKMKAEEHESMREEAKREGAKAFPVIFKDGKYLFSGFSIEKIQALNN